MKADALTGSPGTTRRPAANARSVAVSRRKVDAVLLWRYSGPHSREFWRRVNALPPDARDVLYACGVLLQNLEHSVLRFLSNAERDAGSLRLTLDDIDATRSAGAPRRPRTTRRTG